MKQNKTLYSLYVNKDDLLMEIKPLKKILVDSVKEEAYGGIQNFNGYYYFSNDKKLLIERGQEIKKEWLTEAEDRVNTIENINI